MLKPSASEPAMSTGTSKPCLGADFHDFGNAVGSRTGQFLKFGRYLDVSWIFMNILEFWLCGAEFWRIFDCQHKLPIFLQWTEWVKWIQISLALGPCSMLSIDRAVWFQNCSCVFSSLQDIYATIHVFTDICLLLQDSLFCLDLSIKPNQQIMNKHENEPDIKSTCPPEI